MDLLKILANLFQNGGQHPQAQQAQIPQQRAPQNAPISSNSTPIQSTPNYTFEDGSVGTRVQPPMSDSWDINDPSALYRPTDPRSQQQWTPSGIQTNASGLRQQYGPSPITGAADPRLQVMRGNTPYSPGNGPQTRF